MASNDNRSDGWIFIGGLKGRAQSADGRDIQRIASGVARNPYDANRVFDRFSFNRCGLIGRVHDVSSRAGGVSSLTIALTVFSKDTLGRFLRQARREPRDFPLFREGGLTRSERNTSVLADEKG